MTRPDRPIRTCRQQAFGQFGYLTVPLHAGLAIKEKALARTTPATTQPDKYQLLAFWKPSDYADLPAARKAATSRSRRQVGIIRRSA